jgi:hypothetical protein
MTYPPYRAEAPFDPAEDPAYERHDHRVHDDRVQDDRAHDNRVNARLISRMRWMMVVSGIATMLGIAVVIGVIGYRVYRGEGSTPADVTALLPKGAKIVGTAVAGDRLAIILDAGGVVEVRTFDLRTLQPAGRLKFAAEP